MIGPVIDELTWTEIAELLSDAHSYWIHTTGQTGTPNATPVWGVVAKGVLYHYTESRTLKARNLVHNPRVVVHLESASDVVIVHGDLEHLGHPGGHPEVMRAFERRYQPSRGGSVPTVIECGFRRALRSPTEMGHDLVPARYRSVHPPLVERSQNASTD